jgi:uncharacterized protein
MLIKPEIRIIGWDDGPFQFRKKGKAVLVGVIFRGGNFFDGILKTEIDIDGLDATEKIADAIMKSKYEDLRIIMIDGITFGGYNVVDIMELCKKTKLPVIAVNRKKPDLEKFKQGMKGLPDYEKRLKAVGSAGEFYYAHLQGGKRLCFQKCGMEAKDAEEVIRMSSKHAAMPEPLRVAHLIASGFVLGESVGRA